MEGGESDEEQEQLQERQHFASILRAFDHYRGWANAKVSRLERDMQRPTYEGKTEEANEKEYMARSSLARASVNAGKAMPRRSSVNAMMAAAQAAQE